MKIETPFLLIIILALSLDWVLDGIDFRSFLFGMISTYVAFNYREIFNLKKQ